MAKNTKSARAASKSVTEAIRNWVNGISQWKQEALGRLLVNKTLTSIDQKEILQFCKLAHGVEVEAVESKKPRTLADFEIAEQPDTRRSVRLLSVEKPQNINALCSEQELTFSPDGLTIVFGYNASGKSGYGRILRNVCRGRQKPPELKTNVLVQSSPLKQTVVFRCSCNGNEAECLWDVKRPAPNDLACISIFDSD